MKNKFFVMLIMMFALTGIALADTNETGTNDTVSDPTYGQALNVRYEHLQCKVSFTVKQIELLEEYVPNSVSSNLSSSKDTLEADLDTLKDYADDLNKTSFDSYLEATFRPDFQKATQELNRIKSNFRQYNVSNETKTELIDELKDLKKDYAECVSDKELKMATVMERHMENWNRQWENVIDRMKQKGMNTTQIEALIAEINAKNVELNALIESQNLTKLMPYMNEFRREHLKYATQLEAEKLKSYKGKLNPESRKYNLSGKEKEIDYKIAEIEKYNQKGGRFQEGEFEHAWENAREANKDMKELSKEVLRERNRNRIHNDEPGSDNDSDSEDSDEDVSEENED